MKSSSFAIATAVLLAAICLGVSSSAFGWQTTSADPKPCGEDQAACAQAGASAAPAAPAAAQSTSAPKEKLAFHILAEFLGVVDVKKLKRGDKVKAEVSQDVLWHGKIIIPEESKLVGHITEIKRRGANDPESRLGLVFDRVLLKHHQELDFQGVVQALSPPTMRRSRVDEPDLMAPPTGVVPGQNSTMSPMGNVPATRGSSGSGPSRTLSSIGTMPAGTPTAEQNGSPGNTIGSTARAQQPPMSAGMPRGVFGIKGLALSPGPSSDTPGPVILSMVSDVKLENGTQVLLSITDPKLAKQ